MIHSLGIALLCIVPLFASCTQRPPDPPLQAGEPLGLQMLRTEAQLQKYPFRILLEFEAPTDPVFVRVQDASPRLDPSRKHTGSSSLLLDPGSTSMTVRLPSLFSGSTFPGRWTLAGAYFFAARPQRLTAAYEVDGQPLASITAQLPANQWTPVLLDVAAAADGKPAPIGLLRFSFPAPLTQPLFCDDVIVLDNSQTLVDAPWIIRERGFQFTIDQPPSPRITLQAPEAATHGWNLQEANQLRARFASNGNEKSRTFYSDGRQILDGALVASPDPAAADHHAHPGLVTIAPEMGRLDRNSPGDANNDGYNEILGSYQIIAAAPRIELTIAPGSKPLDCPVLEFAGLPEGKALVNMEGRLVEKTARASNGRLLVILPGILQRSTLVSLRMTQ